MSVTRIAFIDSRVADYQLLVAGLGADTAWFLINADDDGLVQMAQVLSGYGGLQTIDVISHGSSGALTLGGGVLDAASLDAHALQLQQIGASLAPDGDILLYGCDVGAGAAGQAFVDRFAALTGADVAASTDTTGAGGDWVLESTSGVVESVALGLATYAGSLDTITGTSGNDSLVGTAGDDTLVGGAGNDTLDGGAGTDTVSYNSSMAGYRFGFTVSGDVAVTDTDTVTGGNTGVDFLGDVEQVAFSDGTITIRRSGETRVNTYTADDQGGGVSAALPDGGWIATWTSFGQDGSSFGIYQQRFDAAGGRIGAELLVNSNTTAAQVQPGVAVLADGGWLVTWADYPALGPTGDIYAQRFSGDGAKVGAAFLVNTAVTGDQFEEVVAGLADGGWVVSWVSEVAGASAYDIFAQRYDASGARVGVEFRVNAYTNDVQKHTEIVALPEGGWIVAWTSYGQDGSGWGAYAQRYDANGATVGDEFRANTTTANSQYKPHLAVLPSGGWIITWISDYQDGQNGGVYLQRYDADGLRVGGEVKVNETSTNYQEAGCSRVGVSVDGSWLVTWESVGTDGDGFGIYGRRFDADGNPVGGEFRVNQTVAGDQSYSEIVALVDGSFVVNWSSYGQDGSGWGVYSKRYYANGTTVELTGDATANTLTWSGTTPITLDGAGGADSLTGGDGSDVLQGGLGNDSLSGGLGADTLVGGAGNDIYIVDSSSDRITESTNEGTDLVRASVSYTLADNVENLTLSAGASSSGTGNALANRITGNAGANTLDGGAGADTLIGGAGNDTLDGGAGTDTVTYNGPMAGYRFGATVSGDITVTDTDTVAGGNDGVDTLRAVEQFVFSDGTVTLRQSVDPVQYVETRINTTTLSDQRLPAITALEGGGYVVTWLSPDGNVEGIYAQRFDATGAAVGGEIRVNTTTAYSQYDRAITSLSDGGYVVAWASDYQDGSANGVYAQRFSATGAAVGGETLINTTIADSQCAPAVTGLAGGGYVVTWQSYQQDGSAWGIYAQRFDAGGVPVGSETRINTTTVNDQGVPAITALRDGGYVVTWLSPDGSVGGIYAQRFDATGAAVGGEIRVNTTTAYSQYDRAITSLSDGGYVVAWASDYQDGSANGVYAQRFSATGAAVGGETLINTTIADSQCAPAVTGLAGGGYVVTWQSYQQDGSAWGVYAQRYNAVGVPVGGETRVNTTTENDQQGVSVIALADGGYVIAWQSYNQDGSANGIYAQRYDANGGTLELTGDATANILTWSGTTPITLDGAGGADTLTGGAGSDVLQGGLGNDSLSGGLGADILIGEAGNDTYLADVTTDVVTEAAGAGIDLVQSSVDWTLSLNVEKLLLLDGAVSGTGNTQNNTLTGNALSNVLSGLEGNDTLVGAGAGDTLIGGTGNDTYLANLGDQLIEAAGEGTDTVKSNIAWTLGAELENLSLGGPGNIGGTGNNLGNLIRGNDGNNRLQGLGGADTLIGALGADLLEGGLQNDNLTGGVGADRLVGGDGNDALIGGADNDTLTGGKGIDAFVFESALSATTNLDTVVDFAAGVDKLRLDDDVFAAFTVGVALTASQFVSGAGITAAQTADQRIAYNTTTGALYYDADGVGGVGAVQFAVLGSTTHPAQSAGDFVIVA